MADVSEIREGKTLILTCRDCGGSQTLRRIVRAKIGVWPGYIEFYRLHNPCALRRDHCRAEAQP